MAKLLVGLGNPGGRYEKTRHNFGFMVVDQIALGLGIEINQKKCRALVGQSYGSGEKLLLVKPQTYMNRSGEAVLELLTFYKDSITDLIIIHDDLDLEFGRIRFKADGGAGGHKGLQSIIKMLGSQDFSRLKIGIGRPPGFIAVEDYVLQEPNPAEKKLLPAVIEEAARAIIDWSSWGIEKAMNQYNGNKGDAGKEEANKVNTDKEDMNKEDVSKGQSAD